MWPAPRSVSALAIGCGPVPIVEGTFSQVEILRPNCRKIGDVSWPDKQRFGDHYRRFNYGSEHMSIQEHAQPLPLVVCELANSHGGQPDILNSLIDTFGNLNYPRKGIKFQVFAAETIALPDFAWYSVYEELEITSVEWGRLIDRAASLGEVHIDVFDFYSVRVITENQAAIDGIKLQASVLENDEVLSGLKDLNLSEMRVVLNVSGFELTELYHVLERFRPLSQHLVLQIGFQDYPTALQDTALQKISILREAFPDLPLGIADHADGNSDFAELAPVYAHLLGCTYIEKHFCIERATAVYDGYSALEPDQMQRLCSRLTDLGAATHGPFINCSEQTYLAKSIQIPVLRTSLPAGKRIRLENLVFRRTAQTGLSWHDIEALQRQRQLIAHGKTVHQVLNRSDFSPAVVAVIVAARMKSSRLEKKALLPIAGRPSVERCLDQCLSVVGIDKVILATSDLEEDGVLANYRCEGRVNFWAGDPDDVISRYLGACDAHGVDVVVRVTADCPLVAREILEYLLDSHFQTGADYPAAREAPVGTAGEIINVSALREVINRLGRAEHSEYMTWYFRNNPDIFKLNIVELPTEWIRDYRLTLDHKEDLDLFEAVFKKLPISDSGYALADVLAILDAEPELAKLNGHIGLKYRTDENLIAMLNENTRIR